MISFLAKLFIPNRDDGNDPAVRQAYGMLCGIVGIVLNMLLFAGKYFAGLLAGSIAIMADAMNNLTDAGSSVITLIGFKLAGKKNDAEHPFGHGRIEYLAGLAVSMIIILMGVELARDSLQKILHPQQTAFSLLSVGILLAGICVKLYMAWYNRKTSEKIKSVAMAATAADSLSDAVSTGAVLLSLSAAKLFHWQIDGWVGAAVSLMILWTGFRAAKDTIAPLLGGAPDPELIGKISGIVREYPEISGMHDLIVHDYGPGRLMVSLHAEVPVDGDLLTLHDVIDTVEMRLKNELRCHAVIHMDPIATNDEHVNEVKQELLKELRQKLHPDITIHDFRMVEGVTHTNLVFDVVQPPDMQETEKEMCQRIDAIVREMKGDYFAVATVDRNYAAKH